MWYQIRAIVERGGTYLPLCSVPFPLLVRLHKLQLCELQPQSEQCTVISAAFDTSFCNSPYWFTLPPRAPHPPPWLWLSISNLAIFVALLWALINNCVCHRLLSLPTRRLSGLRSRLSWLSRLMSWQLINILQCCSFIITRRQSRHKQSIIMFSLYTSTPFPVNPTILLCILGLQFQFFICAFNCNSVELQRRHTQEGLLYLHLLQSQMEWLMVPVFDFVFWGSTRLIYGQVVAHKHSNQLIAVIFQLASSFA